MINKPLCVIALIAVLGACGTTEGSWPRTGNQVRFDYRDLQAGGLDRSSIPTGKNVITFNAYISSERQGGWRPEHSQSVIEGIRVASAQNQTPAAFDAEFVDEGRSDHRKVIINLDLPSEGTWVVSLGSRDLLPATADTAGPDFGLPDPKSLGRRGDFEIARASVVLRTVGSCTHPVLYRNHFTGDGRVLDIQFSADVDVSAVSVDTSMKVGPVVQVAPDTVRVRIAGSYAPLRLSFLGLAGQFSESLSCAESSLELSPEDLNSAFIGPVTGTPRTSALDMAFPN